MTAAEGFLRPCCDSTVGSHSDTYRVPELDEAAFRAAMDRVLDCDDDADRATVCRTAIIAYNRAVLAPVLPIIERGWASVGELQVLVDAIRKLVGQ